MGERENLADRAALIEQYKIIVEMADRTSARRGIANSFYITLLSALLAFVALLTNQGCFLTWQNILYIVLSVVGILICVTWLITIIAYKKLNRGRFAVIHEIEKHLPYPVFKQEWDILKEVKGKRKYRELTSIEAYIPVVMMIPYISLLTYSIIRLF